MKGAILGKMNEFAHCAVGVKRGFIWGIDSGADKAGPSPEKKNGRRKERKKKKRGTN